MSSTRAEVIAMRKNIASHLTPPRIPIDNSGGGGNDGGMEPRIARLEAAAEYIQRDIADIKHDVREIRSSMRADFLVTWGGIITAALGLALMVAKGFKWL